MGKYPESSIPHRSEKALKLCPWCGGQLVFEPYYPVMRLIPGESLGLSEENVPPTLRTVAAWACETPYCKYREKA